ncbi:hypothetical protein [Oerskovia enterophila]|uniref:hypothetical protein n=1 Tax=Oerskovia enterophila TaxID=43678 RepID=UPI00381C26B5
MAATTAGGRTTTQGEHVTYGDTRTRWGRRAAAAACTGALAAGATAGCTVDLSGPDGSGGTPEPEITQRLTISTPGPDVTAAEVLSADVPSMCGHPAGTLVAGALGGIAPGPEGGVWLRPDSLVLGDLALTGSGADAAAVFDCDHGGVPWPQVVGLFTAGGEVLGVVPLGDLVRSERAWVQDLTIEDRAVRVGWTTGTPDQSSAGGDAAATATLRWDGEQVYASDVELRTAGDTAAELLDAIESGDLDTARTLASGTALADLDALDGEQFGVLDCSGEYGEHRCTGLTESGWYYTIAVAQVEWDTWTVQSIELALD